jgi:hypothetical protein
MKAIQKELGDGDERDEHRRARREDQATPSSPRRPARRRSRAEEAAADEPDVGRGDGGAQLSRLAARYTVGPARASVKRDLKFAEEVLDADHFGLEKVKERIVEYLAVQSRTNKLKRTDPVPRRPSGRRQDLARQVDRQGDRPRVRAHVARRRARRGRDPRSPPHLHRLDARQGHPVDEEGEEGQPALPARRDRQDGHGLPRRSVVGAARSARPRAERSRSWTTTWRSTTTSRT